MGGSADLGPSCKTRLTFDGAGDFSADSPGGRNLHFGIREHAMGAVLNGMALVKVRAYGSTFLIFSDYAKPAIRLSALMELPVIYVFTHDSIGVGEDGPTHQPVEQLASLRAIPGLIVLRPADANEMVEAWKVDHEAAPRAGRPGPHAAGGADDRPHQVRRGRRAWPAGPTSWPTRPTASRTSCCWRPAARSRSAWRRTSSSGRRGSRRGSSACRRGSCSTTSRRSTATSVLPPEVTARVSVEQASTFGWAKYVGATGHSIGMRSFGASAPLKDLVRKFGFSPDHVVAAAREQLQLAQGQLEEAGTR